MGSCCSKPKVDESQSESLNLISTDTRNRTERVKFECPALNDKDAAELCVNLSCNILLLCCVVGLEIAKECK